MILISQAIVTSCIINFAGPFNKTKGRTKTNDLVLGVVHREVGFTWLIPGISDVNIETTLFYHHHHIFTPYGMPTLIVSDGHSKFTSRFW